MGNSFLLVQDLMNESDGDGAFSHRGRHALDIPAPHITHGEHTGQAGFEKMGWPSERPMGGGQSSGDNAGPA